MIPHDVVIIGAGVVGAAIGRELSRFRLSVALLEKEAECGFGVSKSNSGIIHPGTQIPAGTLKGCLCVQGNSLIRRISNELGVDFREVGELIVAFDEAEVARLKELKREGESLGVPRLQLVDKKWLGVHEPNLSDRAVAALYAPTAGIVSPYRLVYDLCENAVKNGAEIHMGRRVASIARAGKFFEVGAAGEVFRARFVVNAAGLHADEVARLAGAGDFTITPRKGEEFILDKKREYIANHLLFPLPTKVSKGILVIKTADGNPMIGPTAREGSGKEDLATSEEGLREVLEGARRMIPAISGDDIIAYFAGLRPVAGEDFIIRREPRVPGFINVAGIQSPGLTAAPAIALMVAGLLKASGLAMRRKLVFRGRQREMAHLFSIPFSLTEKLVQKDPSYGDIVCRCEMVSAKEVRDAIKGGAGTLDGIKFRTRAQAGRCHGSFCTTRIMKILAQEKGVPLAGITKRGLGSEIVKGDRADA